MKMDNTSPQPKIVGLMLVYDIGGEALCANCLQEALNCKKPQTSSDFINLAGQIIDNPNETELVYYIRENDERWPTICDFCGHDMIEEV